MTEEKQGDLFMKQGDDVLMEERSFLIDYDVDVFLIFNRHHARDLYRKAGREYERARMWEGLLNFNRGQ